MNSCDDLTSNLHSNWAYLLTPGKEFTAPVWLGEFGTCHTSPDCVHAGQQPHLNDNGGFWFQCLISFLKSVDLDWSYWAIDGTEVYS